MLEIVKFGQDNYDFPCLLVLGCFEGLHIGHVELLKKAKLQAKINGLDLGVMLFSDGKGGKQLYSFDERANFLEQFGVKFILKVDFTDDFKKIKPLEFLSHLDDKLNIKALMSGKDFRFGLGAKGKAATLKTYADDEENGIWYMSVKDIVYGEDKVSTSLIKAKLEEGNVLLANALLGRNFSVTGVVVKGADRGAKVLGYPTMNIAYPESKFEIKQGVYDVKCTIDGNDYLGIANFGTRPTFDEEGAVLEVHLQNFEGELYDREITVEFTDYIRDIKKFESAEELRAQLESDMQTLHKEEIQDVEAQVD